jgi:RNA-directed DNA polymerase
MKAVRMHVTEKWMLLYIERWLKVPYQKEDGTIIERTMGVPQGSVIGPVLANLFLHYVFDKWMQKNYPNIPFERYADDSICHCVSKKQAEFIRDRLIERFAECKLSLNEEKTKIVYCKDSNRHGEDENESFDYLGFTFRPRKARNRNTHQVFTAFKPAVSKKSSKGIRDEIRNWKILWNYHLKLADIAAQINPVVRGWIQYYSKFGKTEFRKVMDYLNQRLVNWVRRKYKRLKGKWGRAYDLIAKTAKDNRALFSHWAAGYIPYQISR